MVSVKGLAWVSEHRQSYAKKAQANKEIFLPLGYLDYGSPIENCPEFLKQAALRESPEYSADLHYFCVQVEHREVVATGFGEAIFFYLKDAIAFKERKEKEYPNCRFCIDSGGFLSSASEKEKVLRDDVDGNHYVKTWTLQQLSRVQAQRTGKMEAALS